MESKDASPLKVNSSIPQNRRGVIRVAEETPPLPGRIRWVAGYFRIAGAVLAFAVAVSGIANFFAPDATRMAPVLAVPAVVLGLGMCGLLWYTGRLLGDGRRQGAWMAMGYIIPAAIGLVVEGQVLSVSAFVVLAGFLGLVSTWRMLE